MQMKARGWRYLKLGAVAQFDPLVRVRVAIVIVIIIIISRSLASFPLYVPTIVNYEHGTIQITQKYL